MRGGRLPSFYIHRWGYSDQVWNNISPKGPSTLLNKNCNLNSFSWPLTEKFKIRSSAYKKPLKNRKNAFTISSLKEYLHENWTKSLRATVLKYMQGSRIATNSIALTTTEESWFDGSTFFMIKAKILLLFWSVKWPLCYDRVDFIELVFRLPED